MVVLVAGHRGPAVHPVPELAGIAGEGQQGLGDLPGQAKLRLLLIEPAARGLGLGKRLVAECVAFARAAGYSEITLWTQSILTAARGIYAGAGFVLVESRPDETVAKGLISEPWVLQL